MRSKCSPAILLAEDQPSQGTDRIGPSDRHAQRRRDRRIVANRRGSIASNQAPLVAGGEPRRTNRDVCAVRRRDALSLRGQSHRRRRKHRRARPRFVLPHQDGGPHARDRAGRQLPVAANHHLQRILRRPSLRVSLANVPVRPPVVSPHRRLRGRRAVVHHAVLRAVHGAVQSSADGQAHRTPLALAGVVHPPSLAVLRPTHLRACHQSVTRLHVRVVLVHVHASLRCHRRCGCRVDPCLPGSGDLRPGACRRHRRRRANRARRRFAQQRCEPRRDSTQDRRVRRLATCRLGAGGLDRRLAHAPLRPARRAQLSQTAGVRIRSHARHPRRSRVEELFTRVVLRKHVGRHTHRDRHSHLPASATGQSIEHR